MGAGPGFTPTVSLTLCPRRIPLSSEPQISHLHSGFWKVPWSLCSNSTDQWNTPAGGEKSNLLFLNPFILTAHGSEVPEYLQGSHISGESFQFTAFPPKLCGPEDNLGIRKGFSQAATQHHEGQTDGHHHLLSVRLSFPVYRVGQHIPHQRTGVKWMLGRMC